MDGLSVKKKEEMLIRKSAVFAVVFTDSSYNFRRIGQNGG